ncbi:MAG TPA: substrate-binding domain-containing protein [Bacteroidota bacterium]|nr:substrate-binding domain-containing protein [Bacteroidota bacterium]
MIRCSAIILLALPFFGQSWTPPLQDKGEKVQLTVFAAASLNEAFQEIAKLFSKANPSVTVEFSFAHSQQLV